MKTVPLFAARFFIYTSPAGKAAKHLRFKTGIRLPPPQFFNMLLTKP
jgi:hypothetical protein